MEIQLRAIIIGNVTAVSSPLAAYGGWNRGCQRRRRGGHWTWRKDHGPSF